MKRRNRTTLPLIERFMAKVMPEPNTGCWFWMGAICKSTGYGVIGISDRKTNVAHRVSHELFKGPIPHKLVIDHLCRVRCCVNPEHLEAVPQSINGKRGALSFDNYMRRWTHCRRGHEYNDLNTLMVMNYKTGKYGRQCRICHKQMKHERAAGRSLIKGKEAQSNG